MRTVAMFRIGIAVLAGVALFSVVTLAFGQGNDFVPIKVWSKITITPNKAGTPAHPQGVTADIRVKIDIPHDYDPPLAKTVDVWMGKGALYNGRKLPTCSEATIARSETRACPKGSIVGYGTAVVDADGVKSYPKGIIVNGGAKKFYVYAMLSTPARVRQTIVVDVIKLNSPRWSYRLHADIPRNVQIVAGVPLRPESFHTVLNRAGWWASISCPADHRWPYHAEGVFASGQVVTHDGTVFCRS
ncbi:MAG: hypothetical protein ABW167_12795 [Baekduia sp.]